MLYIKEPDGHYRIADEDDVIYEANAIYDRYFSRGNQIKSPEKAQEYMRIKLAAFDHEVFVGLFLNNQHHVISCDELAHGTIDFASVYPREVVKAALQHNAAAVIFAHNHPSGVSEPSQADIHITNKLKDALSLFDIRVLDHLVIGEGVYSFAENGRI